MLRYAANRALVKKCHVLLHKWDFDHAVCQGASLAVRYVRTPRRELARSRLLTYKEAKQK